MVGGGTLLAASSSFPIGNLQPQAVLADAYKSN